MNEIENNDFGPKGILPSEFMRQRRPDCYSDTSERTAYSLDAALLEYHLETLTHRNQTNDFEVFCRKLCERTVCPNLRAHTGPDGGGDSKVDSETYPVSEELSNLFYVGVPAAGKERWAFAFSAKENWESKVRADVKSIVGTERDYDQIIFVTSRFAKDKKRSELEDKLSIQYGIRVTIHDRSWIVQEVIHNNRKDLAFNYLHVGQEDDDPLRLGPSDYSRARQLADIEKAFDDPETFRGMEMQRATEALVAAQLSRNMERPRSETDGRFVRAVRLAEADGTYRQKLEAKYEQIWTAFWWFDDFKFLKDSYAEFEELALRSTYAINLELLCNVLQLLVNSIVHNHLSREECELDARIVRLKTALEKLVKDEGSPNNALEAKTLLLYMQVSHTPINPQSTSFQDIWKEMSDLLDKARGLGEYRAEQLLKLIEALGEVAGDDSEYNELVEKTANFVSERRGEAEGALILLKRAQKLGFAQNLEMIRFLGKASVGLSKKEYSAPLIEALQLLMLAYRSAGLLWASRSSCSFLSATLTIEGEENGQIPVSIVPAMKIWAWIALQLRILPDFLFAVQILNGALTTLPLDQESKEKLAEDLEELDAALGCLILNLQEEELRKLENLPDVFEGLRLFIARAALMYISGHEQKLKDEKFIPLNEPVGKVKEFFSLLANQPCADDLQGKLILNSGASELFSTEIIGMSVEVTTTGSTHSILVAVTLLGSLEAFFATALDHRVVPHTDRFRVNIIETQDRLPSFELDEFNLSGTIYWPIELSPAQYGAQHELQKFWLKVCGDVLATCYISENSEIFLEKLFRSESVLHRIMMVSTSLNSYHRVASEYVLSLSNWIHPNTRTYSIRTNRPSLTKSPNTTKKFDYEYSQGSEQEAKSRPADHRAYNIQSLIDIHAWDKAKWKGVAYADYGPQFPPCMALHFEDASAGNKIFERWNERFGERDEFDELYISIVRNLPNRSKNHYFVVISKNLPAFETKNTNKTTMLTSRSLLMEPNNSNNLERFLSLYQIKGAFHLMPTCRGSDGSPKLFTDLSILKTKIRVLSAKDISESDIEHFALKASDRGFK